MNRELNELLEAASADVREVDFTERAWAGAERRRARTRRTALAGVAAAAAVAVVAGTFTAGHRTPARPLRPPASPGRRPRRPGEWPPTAPGMSSRRRWAPRRAFLVRHTG